MFDARTIYLTGFMGCGKSTLGPIAANVLGRTFFDLDEEIVTRVGRSIPEIFEQEGEAGFRIHEADALREVGTDAPSVVALGGGAFVQSGNAQWLLHYGLVVYLRLPTSTLAERLLHSPTPRPLLFGPDGNRLPDDALRARVRTLVAEREPQYKRAHLTVDVGDVPIGQAVDRLVGALRKRLR